jgi:signal peptidase I
MKRGKEGGSRGGGIVELVVIVAVAIALAFTIQAFLVKPYRIPSGSMEPTLAIGQRVLVNRIGHSFNPPSIGEIVVFHPPKDFNGGCANPEQGVNPTDGQAHPQPCSVAQTQRSDQNFIKRVVGRPGDRIAIIDGHVIRNGVRQKEPFIRPCSPGDQCNFPTTIRVPPGEYYMMGDNRGQSDDSRFWGPVPDTWIIGGAFATYWPPNRLGIF